ncbi:nodulation protein NodN [Brevirhabdus pacifica]|uniref:Nodulation protein NodN n=1 Tax=Brevirhabdus pacifica TaxID=1267768 RepID=A0A1U7DL94_9RHOB|nr:MaoC family dehydratase [Brevirhabdus pacifica]APX90776.1 nodulation protein NodN [Brevirhabdus pacifica]PJJ87345.1 acyl dehydratase [Brevirhabdus pacifica]
MAEMTRDEMAASVGQELGVSDWLVIDQARIDAFADVSGDHQYIHVDPDRARAETPFGGTIAHGFLTVSVLSALAAQAQPRLAGMRMSINYGFDRLRFLNPVRVGARIRARFVLNKLEERRPGEITVTWDVTVEIEGEEKPALVAQWLNRRYLGETDAGAATPRPAAGKESA